MISFIFLTCFLCLRGFPLMLLEYSDAVVWSHCSLQIQTPSITLFEPSSYLALPLMSIMNLARLGLEIHCLLHSYVESEI
jgi:hypothetical protein